MLHITIGKLMKSAINVGDILKVLIFASFWVLWFKIALKLTTGAEEKCISYWHIDSITFIKLLTVA